MPRAISVKALQAYAQPPSIMNRVHLNRKLSNRKFVWAFQAYKALFQTNSEFLTLNS